MRVRALRFAATHWSENMRTTATAKAGMRGASIPRGYHDIPSKGGKKRVETCGPVLRKFSSAATPTTNLVHPCKWNARQGNCGAMQRRQRTFAASSATDAPTEETFEYQTETNRLMDLIVNSLYSNRDVFLRELVSNASDALDKVRFLALSDSTQLGDRPDLEIKIRADKDTNTVVIEDSGVGMTKSDLMDSLGTIARSGTAKFMEKIKDSQETHDANLIGQFGVGFYSAFLVADRVTVQTKNNADNTQWIWQSSMGSTSYSVKPDDGEPLGRGTRITLHLKEDAEEFCDPAKLQDLVKTYSEFINFPIKVWGEKTVPKEVVDVEATEKAREEAKKKAEEEGKEPEEVKEIMKTEYENVPDWIVQNENKPIWIRNPKEVSKEEYNGFFKTTFREFLDPLAQNHFNVEGTIEFRGILYVPGMAPFDSQQNFSGKSNNIKLYVKRVFISDEFDTDLMPRYLNFIKGVIDSSDLPLNVSREILQESRITRIMRKQLIKRSFDMIKEISKREDKSDYNTFWESFGKNIKLGIIEDPDNKAELAKFLRFYTTKSGDETVSLDDYIGRMKPEQKDIFYLAADNKEAAENAPFLEQLRKKDFEVIYLTEPIDEVAFTNLGEYQEKKLADVSKEDLALGEETEEEKQKEEQVAEQFKDVTEFMAGVLGGKVEKVVISKRLSDSPAILVTSKFGWSANMEKIMKAQAMGDSSAMEYMKGRKIMEINPDSPIIKDIKSRIANNKSDPQATEVVSLMYDTALLTSGFPVENPRDFAKKIYDTMTFAAGLSSEADSSDTSSTAVEPEVVDPEDPWK